MRREITTQVVRFSIWISILLVAIEFERLLGLLGLSLWILIFAYIYGLRQRYIYIAAFLLDAVFLRPLGSSLIVLVIIFFIRSLWARGRWGWVVTWVTAAIGITLCLKLIDHNSLPFESFVLVPILVLGLGLFNSWKSR